MVHKQSVFAQQRRLARKLALTSAFQDRIRKESVYILSHFQLEDLISAEFEYVLPGAAPDDEELVRGEVLRDSRGRGSFQEGNMPVQ